MEEVTYRWDAERQSAHAALMGENAETDELAAADEDDHEVLIDEYSGGNRVLNY